jgi:hypothetical protein
MQELIPLEICAPLRIQTLARMLSRSVQAYVLVDPRIADHFLGGEPCQWHCQYSGSFPHTTMVNPSDPQAAALLAHIVSQITSNVDFLVSQNYMSQSDASIIVSKLTTDAVVNQPASRAQVMLVGAP